MSAYDKYYKQENYFKRPCPELIEFFINYPKRGSLCDLGAGQGRDSIPLHNAGYDVTAVDISDIGLNQIKQASPAIKTVIFDVYEYNISQYDYILTDSMLHFFKNDIEKETNLARRILDEMKSGSVWVNNMIKSKKAERMLEDIILEYGKGFVILDKKHIDYPDYNSIYHFLAVKKEA